MHLHLLDQAPLPYVMILHSVSMLWLLRKIPLQKAGRAAVQSNLHCNYWPAYEGSADAQLL